MSCMKRLSFPNIFNGIFTHQKLMCSLICQSSLLLDCCMR
ncbi:hypothetical protein HPHPA16_0701 [Helicobacter pylori Hp A-16]|nr:hypothetical protein HPHPA16_0701 [Helicobacter pylori Hp A-16]